MPGNGVQVLVGDIGGTNVRLRIVQAHTAADSWQVRHQATLGSRDFASLEAALASFLDKLPPAEREALCGAWLAIAAPVVNGRARFTNLPWDADTRALSAHLALPEVHLVNDLEAHAHAVAALGSSALKTIRQGNGVPGRHLLVAVGTGLGAVSWSQLPHALHVVPSEGGHSDFAPVTDWQAELWRWLSSHHPHVSYERLLSGQGLVELYDFLHVQAGLAPPEPAAGDRAASIVQLADTEGDDMACSAIDHFASILGSFCGNAALHTMPTAGVYLAGGVVRHLYSRLSAGHFLEAFSNKGRMAGLLQEMPVHAITLPEPGLEGITRVAIRACYPAQNCAG